MYIFSSLSEPGRLGGSLGPGLPPPVVAVVGFLLKFYFKNGDFGEYIPFERTLNSSNSVIG